MKIETSSRKVALAAQMTKIAGCEIDICVRGARKFTFAADGFKADELAKITKFFGDKAICQFHFDAECDYSCLYVEVK